MMELTAPPRVAALSNEDYDASATVRDMRSLERCLDYIRDHADHPLNSLLDLGCGRGWLTLHVASRLGIEAMAGIDRDAERLAVASERGIRAWKLDLEHHAYPVEMCSQDVVCTFGMFEHIVYYDHVLSEVRRVLRPGGWLLIAMPNLGSYLNRLSLLVGAQPRNVEISKEVPAGIMRAYKGRLNDDGRPIGHIHTATLSAMREVLAHHGFDTQVVQSSSPDFGSRLVRIANQTLGRFPSLARRYIIVARRRD